MRNVFSAYYLHRRLQRRRFVGGIESTKESP
jgi:hypothetical protein